MTDVPPANQGGSPWQWYLAACVGVFVAALGTTVLIEWLTPSLSLLFFPVVVVTGLYGGYGPALFATLLSTTTLAYFFVPPIGSLSIGVDDGIRLAAFASVALLTASIGVRRARAEVALRDSLAELQGVLDTMQRIRDWPASRWSTTDDAARALAQGATTAVDCGSVVIVWSANGQPDASIAESGTGGATITPCARAAVEPLVATSLADESFVAWPEPQGDGEVLLTTRKGANAWAGTPVHPTLQKRVGSGAFGSAPFATTHASGRVFFCSLRVLGVSALPRVELVAKEIGESLERAPH